MTETVFYLLFISIVLLLAVIVLIMTLRTSKRRQALAQGALVDQLRIEIMRGEEERTATGKLFMEHIWPTLTALNLMVNSLDVPPTDIPLLDKINGYVDGMLQTANEASRDMQLRIFYRKQLGEAICEFAMRDASLHDKNIFFTGDAIPDLSPDRALHVYRVCVAMLHQAILHHENNELEVHCIVNESLFKLSCKVDHQSNGEVTFNYFTPTAELNRVTILHAEYDVTNERNDRTVLRLSVPLHVDHSAPELDAAQLDSIHLSCLKNSE